MQELGSGFSFISNEYPIKLGDRYNYIDLLLYNCKYKSSVVIELKTTKLKKEHTGQIQNYMNYIDKNIKEISDSKTVGIIICKKYNRRTLFRMKQFYKVFNNEKVSPVGTQLYVKKNYS